MIRSDAEIAAPPPPSASDAVPQSNDRVFITMLELAAPPPVEVLPVPLGYQQVRILVRLHGAVLGYRKVAVPPEGVRMSELLADCEAAFAVEIQAHLDEDGLGTGGALPARGPLCTVPPRTTPLVSVVVCTRNRAAMLPACLEGLRTLTYPEIEILVVDNAPDDDSTQAAFDRTVGSDPRFRYVRAPLPGLSRARNQGISEARGEIVAYTDDDVLVEPDWIEAVVRGFERGPEVGCVTGLVAAASLEGPAEQYFDARVSWSHNCRARIYDLQDRRGDNPLYPYSPGIFGTGANFSFRKTALEAIGRFDEALGAGTLTRGGEDLDAFVLVLQAGWAIAYEPNAVVWHHHRSDLHELDRQMFGYGTGLAAFITKHLLSPHTLVQVVRRVVPGTLKIARSLRDASRGVATEGVSSRDLAISEFRGLIAGPYLFLRARRLAARREAG